MLSSCSGLVRQFICKRIVPTLAIAASVFSTTIEKGYAGEQPLSIVFSHVVANETPKGKGALRLKSCLEDKFKDNIKFTIYPNSTLYSDGKVIDALNRGEVQFAAPSLSQFVKYSKKFALFDLPFLFDSIQAVDRFQNSAKGRAMLQSLEERGLTGLAFWHNGMKQMSANVPLNNPQNARELKFRIQPSEVLAAQFDAMGAYPIKRPFGEVKLLLSVQAIDGTENPWSNTYSQKFYEDQKYITETDHGVLDYLLVTSSKWWNGLSETTRMGIGICIDEATRTANDEAQRVASSDRQKVIDSGLTKVLSLTNDERNQWKALMRPLWARYEAKIGKDLIEAAQEANGRSSF